MGYSTPNCIRRQPQPGFSNYAITVDVPASVNHDLTCFFPQLLVPSLTNFQAELMLITVNSFPYYPGQAGGYGGYNKILSGNTITTTVQAITTGLGVSESPNLYAGFRYVGDTLFGGYSLTVPFSIISDPYTPYIYINFQSGGPIPIHDLCGNNAIF